ncbi:hypothetical protein SPBR_02518 [Sporothrix brasiliensis 5110]|uniref:BTB domain-containing protein n=1 Tax=Sporothrix brasiliensis 5110 TaxID=1398154 RepID=A0A0C2J6U8_9PEZI|nr:uncharacterized protein SPBR_02518 [Sporothrix brasiliensis 5110]KIH92752.1 hypothetical protein SPBR_02518 [Sporothrix brasiliensis 5110]
MFKRRWFCAISGQLTQRLEATTSQERPTHTSPARRHTAVLEDSRPGLRKRRKTSRKSSYKGIVRDAVGRPSNSAGGGAAAARTSAEAVAAATQAGPSMSGHHSQDSSLGISHNMDVDGGDASGINGGAGAEDWTQHESIFNSPPPPGPSVSASTSISVVPPPPATNSGISHANVASNSSNPSTSPPRGPIAAASGHILGETPSPNAQKRVISPRPGRSTQRGSKSQSVVDVPPLAAAATTAAATARAKEREKLITGPLMFRMPLSIATIMVNGREFFIHANLLCKESDYFTRCLRGGFAEAETQRIEINDEDVSVEDFGLWVDLLYRSHFQKPEKFLLRKEETGGTLSTMQILTLWKLSDRFMNRTLAAMAEESLHHRLSLYSVEQWRKLYRTRPSSDIKSRVSRLQDAYHYCCDQELPFVNDIVAACANCPAQVYADCASLFEVDFMMLVSQRMIMAHADNQLVSKDQRMSSNGNKPTGAAATGANSTLAASDSGM